MLVLGLIGDHPIFTVLWSLSWNAWESFISISYGLWSCFMFVLSYIPVFCFMFGYQTKDECLFIFLRLWFVFNLKTSITIRNSSSAFQNMILIVIKVLEGLVPVARFCYWTLLWSIWMHIGLAPPPRSIFRYTKPAVCNP